MRKMAVIAEIDSQSALSIAKNGILKDTKNSLSSVKILLEIVNKDAWFQLP